jgi:hypothetical protein
MGKALRKIAGEAFQPNVIFFGKQAKGPPVYRRC